MDAREVKELLPLSKVAELYNIPLTRGEGYTDCPFCGGHLKLKVTRDTQYKCYRCETHGDIFDLLVQKGVVSNFSEALGELAQHLGCQSSQRTVQYFRRIQGLEKVFKGYQAIAQQRPEIVKALCSKRGWEAKIPLLGLATSSSCLVDGGHITGLELEELGTGMLSEDGREYFDNHLIFPIYNEAGRMVHLQGRALDGRELRWKATRGKPGIDNYFYNSSALYHPQGEKTLYICEGATDCISLLEIGLPAIGQFGVNIPLILTKKHFAKFDRLVFLYDNDVFPLGHAKEGQSKSWSSMLDHVVELAQELKDDTSVYYLSPPEYSGVKDVNDWLCFIEYEKERFKKYESQHRQDISKLAEQMWRGKLNKHPEIWKLYATSQDWAGLCNFLRNNGVENDIEGFATYLSGVYRM